LAPICTKSFVGWGFAPDPTGGAYSAPPDPLAELRGPTSKGRGTGGEGEGGGEEGEREGRDLEVPPQVNFLDPPMRRVEGRERREGRGGFASS